MDKQSGPYGCRCYRCENLSSCLFAWLRRVDGREIRWRVCRRAPSTRGRSVERFRVRPGRLLRSHQGSGSAAPGDAQSKVLACFFRSPFCLTRCPGRIASSPYVTFTLISLCGKTHDHRHMKRAAISEHSAQDVFHQVRVDPGYVWYSDSVPCL